MVWFFSEKGITGTVSIDSNGDRNADYSLLDMNPETGEFQVSITSPSLSHTSQ
jgi:atrial natriuretic peptide receptor A